MVDLVYKWIQSIWFISSTAAFPLEMAALTATVLLALSPLALAQCPQVHIFGARETTVPPGYGTSQAVVNSIISAFPGATSEAINYPACGGQASCGSVSYANSVIQGVSAVASQVNSFNQKCPSTFLVLVGYSQGGQIFDDAYCGGGDTNEGLSSTAIPISTAAQAQIKAAIFMGDPRHIPGLSYNVGTCQASGVSSDMYTCITFLIDSVSYYSSLPVQLASNARMQVTSNRTATLPIPTAVMVTMPILIKVMPRSTVPSLLLSLRTS